jgi:tetratricopeptide (TPR) repeat protein/tRNA A-37 threonylcarbamoyl transferase component Bud32
MATEGAEGAESENERVERLGRIVAEFHQAEREGRAPSRAELDRRHPDLADDLAAYFDDKAYFDQLAEEIRPDGSWTDPTVPFSPPAHAKAAAALRCGTTFGDYELLEEVGSGGMGVVYKARQISRDRIVALKTIKHAEFASDADVKRFLKEAQALSRVAHPNIVPIYDVGRHDGRDFFSMKFIEGTSLEGCQRRLQSDPTNTARIMALVARAIHHAHQRLRLHRDLKPSNILLDQHDQPYVTDFGLAKLISDGVDLTRSGASPGTPRWMAPEQASLARGGVTTAIDIHGLGAVLYFLLTRKSPFPGNSVKELLNQIASKPPEPPRKWNSRVDRDLEIICLKCLEKEPKDRYSSAAAVADDLDNWLAGKPIKARPVGRLKTAVRWAWRNPLIAGLVGAVATLLLAGFIGLIVSNQIVARKNVEITRQRNRARQAVDMWFNQFADQELAGIPGTEKKRRDWLERIKKYYEEEAAQGRGSDPESRMERAGASFRLGRAHSLLSELDGAGQAYADAVPLLERLVSEFPGDPSLPDMLARSLNELGLIYWKKDRRADAEVLYQRALTTADAAAGTFPDRPELRDVLASILHNLAVLKQETRKLAESEASYRRAIAIQRQVLEERPGLPGYRQSLALHLAGFARLLDDSDWPRSRWEESDQTLRDGLAILDDLAADFPSVADYRARAADLRNNLGDSLMRRGRPEEADGILRQAVADREQLALRYPDVPDHHASLGFIINSLAECLRDQGRYEEARDLARRAIAIQKAVLKAVPNHPTYLYWLFLEHTVLAESLLALGDSAGASAAAAAAIGVRPAAATVSNYYLARAWARCIPRLEKNPKLTAAQRRQRAKAYGDRVVEFLREVAKTGLEAKDLEREPDFAALRDHPGYQALIRESARN